MAHLDPGKISASLGENGEVASLLPSWEPRQAQLDLLALIIRGFNEDAVVAAEAGTGVGKSFAYLLPAMRFALQTKEKVVISTATITLQQQLFEKDIPLVASATGGEIKSVIMKGRGNYICLRRLDDALHEPPLDDSDYNELKNIAEWSKTTGTGVRSEISFMPSDTVWSSVCSESDLCLASHCPWRDSCFILKMRKEANNAQIIVVNHHLLFADLAARYNGAGYESAVILPPFNRLIIDEAHTIENAATSFFSSEFSRAGILRQLSRLYYTRRRNKKGLLVKLRALLPADEDPLDTLAEAVKKIRSSAEDLDDCALDFCGAEGIFRLSSNTANESALKKTLFAHLKNLRKNIISFTSMLRDITENIEDTLSDGKEAASSPLIWEIKTIIKRLENTAEICDVFCKFKKHANDVLWIESRRNAKTTQAVFTKTPLDLSPLLKDCIYSVNKTIICVSATLAINNNFSFWARRCGLDSLEKREILYGCFPSPFPYSSSVLLVSPEDAPLPDEEDWQEFINKAAGSLTAAAGGSALVLFTSYQCLSSAYQEAKNELTSLGIKCLKQGDDDRTRLLQTFISDESSCLFATDSFWEGVDAPGETLRLVIICRLPFRTPGDPVFEARCEVIQQQGGSSFMELSLPHAVMKFKQGFGRLMRRSTDHGVIAVLDSRLRKKQYGRLFLQSLPETKTSFGTLESILKDMENHLY